MVSNGQFAGTNEAFDGIKIVIRQDTKWKTALLRCRKYSIEKIRLYDLICTFATD